MIRAGAQQQAPPPRAGPANPWAAFAPPQPQQPQFPQVPNRLHVPAHSAASIRAGNPLSSMANNPLFQQALSNPQVSEEEACGRRGVSQARPCLGDSVGSGGAADDGQPAAHAERHVYVCPAGWRPVHPYHHQYLYLTPHITADQRPDDGVAGEQSAGNQPGHGHAPVEPRDAEPGLPDDVRPPYCIDCDGLILSCLLFRHGTGATQHQSSPRHRPGHPHSRPQRRPRLSPPRASSAVAI